MSITVITSDCYNPICGRRYQNWGDLNDGTERLVTISVVRFFIARRNLIYTPPRGFALRIMRLTYFRHRARARAPAHATVSCHAD